MANPKRVSAAKRASLLPFVFVMYAYTTGGPFGLEGQVTTSGPGMTLIYHLLLPFFWCIPVSFVSAELTTAMPVCGGFYRWSRAAFGDFWGFLAGWWNWSASFILGGVYAVLFADYLKFYIPQLGNGWKHYLIALLVIAVITLVNVIGIDAVGKVATVLGILILVPIAVMCAIAATKWHHNPFVPFIPPGATPKQVAGVGLALGLWLYSGFEQLSTVADEVEDPQRTFPRALAWVVPMSMATYFLPTLLLARRARQLAAMEGRLFLRRRLPHRRTLARLRREPRRSDHVSLIAQWDGARLDAHAFRHGGRRVSAEDPDQGTSAFPYAMDRDPGLGCNLRGTLLALAIAADHCVCVAARGDHVDDSDCRLAFA